MEGGRRAWAGYAVAAAIAALPVLRMIGIVLDTTPLQSGGDYWLMLPDLTTHGGGLDIGGLLSFHNGHLLVFAKIVYWLNIHLFAGSNVALGLIDVALVVGQLVVVVLMLRRTALGPVQRMVAVVVASTLLFGLSGTWNFANAMSGTAWLSANLFALVAVYMRGRGRKVGAGALAVLASVSYGTGIAAWPAVIAAGITRRDTRAPWKAAWREWPYAAGFVATYLLHELGPVNAASTTLLSVDVVEVTAATFGFVYGFDDGVVRVLGYVGLLAIPAVAASTGAFSRSEGAGHWVGVATYGWMATLVIGLGRAGYVEVFGLQNRYYSLPALAWLGFFLLVVLGARRVADRSSTEQTVSRRLLTGPAAAVVLAAVMLLGTVGAGRAHADEMTQRDERDELREIALRLGLADGTTYFFEPPWNRLGEISPSLAAMGHYPFVEDWGKGCGLVDEPLPGADDAGRLAGSAMWSEPGRNLPGAMQVTGHFRHSGPVGCILVTDGSSTVIGVAVVVGGRSGDGADGDGADGDGRRYRYQGLARRADSYSVFVLPADDGPPMMID